MDDHEAAAADISRARIGHGQGKAGCHRGIDRVAAPQQHIGTQSCGYLLLSNDHAVFGDHGMNGVAGGRRVKAAALLLRGSRHAIRDNQQDCRQYPAPLCKEAHLNSAAGLVNTGQGFRRHKCYMDFAATGKTPPRDCDLAGHFEYGGHRFGYTHC